jgi:hypothetical protein
MLLGYASHGLERLIKVDHTLKYGVSYSILTARPENKKVDRGQTE